MDFFLLIMLPCLIHLGASMPATKKNKLRDVDWFAEGQNTLKRLLEQKVYNGPAKNVIIFVGDGMGISTSTGARLLKSQRDDTNLFGTKLAWETFPYAALSKPYQVDQFTGESAGTASAIFTGVKTNAGALGVNSKTLNERCDLVAGNEVKSILHHSHEKEKWTGIITTDRLSGGTPAASYASSADRDWETDTDTPPGCKDIAAQLIEDNDFIRVLLGGGRSRFTGKNQTDVAYPKKGSRTDNRDLIKLWEDKQLSKVSADAVNYVTNKTDFDAVNTDTVEYLMGMFERSKMHQEVDRTNTSINLDEEPSIAEMTQKAIEVLRRSESGYFLLVEGARIDNGHHSGTAHKALTDTLALSEAVQKAAEMTDEEDTLIVVTADHSHTFVITGYPHPDNDIFGVARTAIAGTEDEVKLELGLDGLPYLTLAYISGPGYVYHKTNGSLSGPTTRRDLLKDEADGKTREANYEQDTAVPRKSETHAGEEVAVYARGPMSHLFRGVLEQSDIGHIMMYASCVGPNVDNCNGVSSSGNTPCQHHKSTMIFMVLVCVISKFGYFY